LKISDNEELGQLFDQAEFQIVHVDIGGGANDTVEAALGLPVNSALVAA